MLPRKFTLKYSFPSIICCTIWLLSSGLRKGFQMAHCKKYFGLFPYVFIQALIAFTWCFLFSNFPVRLKTILSSEKYFLFNILKLKSSKARGTVPTLSAPFIVRMSLVSSLLTRTLLLFFIMFSSVSVGWSSS